MPAERTEQHFELGVLADTDHTELGSARDPKRGVFQFEQILRENLRCVDDVVVIEICPALMAVSIVTYVSVAYDVVSTPLESCDLSTLKNPRGFVPVLFAHRPIVIRFVLPDR